MILRSWGLETPESNYWDTDLWHSPFLFLNLLPEIRNLIYNFVAARPLTFEDHYAQLVLKKRDRWLALKTNLFEVTHNLLIACSLCSQQGCLFHLSARG